MDTVMNIENNPVAIVRAIADNMEKVVIGKRRSIELLLLALISGGHILIEDVPGVGKTSLVSALARSVDGSFRRVQFTPDILPSDITGFSMYNQKTGEFEFRSGAVMSNFLLADEINRTSAKTQASLLEVMQENQVTVDGKTYPVPSPFMVIATQNSVEYLGTYPLPEAQMDRFFMRISMGYPTPEQETAMLALHAAGEPLHTVSPVATVEDILRIRKAVPKVETSPALLHYLVSLVEQTRRHPAVQLGASPRASIALHRAAQALAFCSGRSFVLPDDVQTVLVPVLAHRMLLSWEAKMAGRTTEDVLFEICRSTPVPGTGRS